jgi:hypothetical protein
MSYIDGSGVEHPTMSDRISAWANAHIASCPTCAPRFGASGVGVLPVASSGADAESMLDAGCEAVVVVRRRDYWKGDG